MISPVISTLPLAFACDPEQARAVRSHVRNRVVVGGRAELAQDAVTVVSELFANAVTAQLRQGITTVIPVQASVHGTTITIDLYDHANGKPVLRPVGPDSLSGRGLHMVHALTGGRWRWEPWGTGKVVTATLG